MSGFTCDLSPIEPVKELFPEQSNLQSLAYASEQSKEHGCIHCTCKKNKCLTRYCKCFSSRKCCVESCWCNDCHNKTGNEEVIVEARLKIEARCPFAFADENRNAAAKQSKGCTCRKSSCSKRYCECFSVCFTFIHTLKLFDLCPSVLTND